jgi:uncharacterized protein YggT (Ycf19 family)
MKEILQKVQPTGATPIGKILRSIIGPYLQSLGKLKPSGGDIETVKPINVIVITDGLPTDNLETISV